MNGIAHPTDDLLNQQNNAGDYSLINGAEPMSGSSFSMLSSLENLLNEISHEEAVEKLKVILVQNAELRDTAQQLKVALQSAYHCIRDNQSTIEQERNEVREKYQQTREVVTKLQHAIKQKDGTIALLDKHIKEMREQMAEKFKKDKSLDSRVWDLQQKIRELEKNCEIQRQQADTSSCQLDGMKSLNVQLMEDKNTLTKSIHEMKEQLGKLSAEREMTTEYIQRLQDTLRMNEEVVAKMKSEKRESIGSTETAAPLSREWSNTREEVLSSPHGKVKDEEDFRKKEAALEGKIATLNEQLRQQIEVAAQLQQQLQQIDAYTSQKEQLTLKEQNVFLMAELTESHSKTNALLQEKQKLTQRCEDAEKKTSQVQQTLQQRLNSDDRLIQTLKNSKKELEDKLASHEVHSQKLNSNLTGMSVKYRDLCTDYHQLLTKHENYRSAKEREAPPTGRSHQRELEEKIDNLTAQVITAEEALNTKDRMLRDLQKKYESDRDKMGALEAQAEVFKADFEDERAAKEKLQKDNEKLKTENQQYRANLKQQQDQLVQLTQSRLSEYRHAPTPPQPHARIREPSLPVTSYPPPDPSVYPGHRDRPGIAYPPSVTYPSSQHGTFPTLPSHSTHHWQGKDMCDNSGNSPLVGNTTEKKWSTMPGSTGPMSTPQAIVRNPPLEESDGCRPQSPSASSRTPTPYDARGQMAGPDISDAVKMATEAGHTGPFPRSSQKNTLHEAFACDVAGPPEEKPLEKETKQKSAPDETSDLPDGVRCPKCEMMFSGMSALNSHMDQCLDFDVV